ncbi:MAG: adenosylcobinamide-GDP ribazoletransferase, partial [Bacteroidetes bacterium]|nr:adenosylcobinamide-GDP ribazoletransferase [Bacteroidota bacterium]
GRVRIEMLVLFPALSRWAVLAAMEAFPYARREGMGPGFQAGRTRWQIAAGFAVALAASIGLAGVAGVVLLAIASLVALALGRWMARMLGGLTGDSYGAINELAAVAVLLAAIVLGNEASSLYGAPFYSGG